MEKTKKSMLTSLLFSLILTLFLVLVMATNMLKAIENFNYDFILEHGNDVNDKIVIVAIDDQSLSDPNLGKYESWKRSYYADVIDKVNKYNPSVIGIDVLFTGTSDEESDNALVNAVKGKDNIVLGTLMQSVEVYEDGSMTKKVVVSKPFEELSNAVSEDSFGFTNTLADNDGFVRKATLSSRYDGTTYSSIAEQVFKKYADKNDLDYKEYKTNKKYYIDYNAKPGYGFEYISFADIFNNVYSDEILESYFEDSIVLIGAYATRLSDDYYTPISHNVKMNGVEIHANIINNMINDSFKVDANKAIQFIINIIFVCGIIFLISRLKFLFATITAAGAIIFEFLLGLILYNCKIYYPIVAVCLVLFIGYIAVVVYNYVRERMEKGAVIKTFKQYMAPQVVEAFMKDDKQSSNLVGERRDVACLFVDIRGFTRMSETLVDPVKVVKILNDYLGMTTKQIFDNDGMLDKFIGDACMAIFNAPFDINDYEYKAIKAGLGIVKNGDEIAKKVFDEYGITIGFGVGVNCGEAIIGNIGCDFRKDYTGIGDTINTASRLESNAKGGQVIISEETLNRVDSNGNFKLKDRLIVEENGYLTLKGKAKPVLTYNVIGLKEDVKEENNEEDTNDSAH